MSEDSFKLSVGASEGSVEVKGSAASRIAHQFADLVSPFTEIAGLGGDRLRIYRQASAERILQRAIEIATEEQRTIQHVHTKNLVPIIEAASLEGDHEHSISELWSRLLLSGHEAFDSELAMFTDVFKRIGKREADLFGSIIIPEEAGISTYPDGQLTISRQNYMTAKQMLEAVEDADSNEEMFEILNSIRQPGSFHLGAFAGATVTRGWYSRNGVGERPYNKEAADSAKIYTGSGDPRLSNHTTWMILCKEGLLNLKTVDIRDGSLSCSYLEASLLGAKLMARCYPGRVIMPL